MSELPIIRTSERAVFKRCPQRWWWEYRQGYRQRSPQADALWFGIGVHEALAKWYLKGKRRGPHPADTWQIWTGEEIAFAKTYLDDTFDEPVWMDAVELGTAMLEAYTDFYGRDLQWDIIAIEQPFKVRITQYGKPVAYFASRWDGVLRDYNDGKVYLLENKTAAQINTAYLELDDQAGSYWAVASQLLRANGVLRDGERISGIIYNFLRKAKPDDRPVNEDGLHLNKDGGVSKKQPPQAFVRQLIERSPGEQRTQLERIADEVEIMNSLRAGTVPLTKITNKDCPRCPFWVPCTLHERGSDNYKTVLKNNFRISDPYADMRKAALCHLHEGCAVLVTFRASRRNNHAKLRYP
jgi:hypothetical protein